MASTSIHRDAVDIIRAFNRLYTQKIGVLTEKHLGSDLSLTQVRLLYELAHCEAVTATDLRKHLGLDAGYVSRTLSAFRKRGWLEARPAPSDRRQTLLSITGKGRKAFAPLDDKARAQIRALLDSVAPADRERLVNAIRTVHGILEAETVPARAYLLRSHRPGDMGWVIHRHGALYAEEYGWDERFEALVAHIAADFIDKLDAKRERCWIAEMNGKNVGSVFLVKKTRTVAKLRLLLVEPEARGLGIGRRLAQECIGFARQAGYRKITLWTQSILTAARKIYQDCGFELTHKQPNAAFGQRLVSETWELKL